MDGFARDDIFYIDPEGRTASPCFEELKHLCSTFAPAWFTGNNDLAGILSRMELAEGPRSIPVSDASGSPGSYNWNRLRSVLLLVRNHQSPSEQSAGEALAAVNRVMGTIFDFSTIQSGPPREEGRAIEMRELWERLANFLPVDVVSANSMALRVSLDGPIWAAEPKLREITVDPDNSAHARKRLWPILKSFGFSEFTDRLAHRASSHLVEVVEIFPVDRAQRKEWSLPTGLFRIGLGAYWPALEEHTFLRKNRMCDPRPAANECHVSNWLVPEAVVSKRARTAFNSIEDALSALTGFGLGWLDIFRDSDQALALLQRKNFELFWRYPFSGATQ